MDGVKGFLGGLAFLLLALSALAVDALKRLWRKIKAGWDKLARL